MTTKYKNIILKLLIFILSGVFFLCLYLLLKDFWLSKVNTIDTNILMNDTIQVNNETNDTLIDWNKMKSVNEDIIGWIVIEDTNINYPILKDHDLYYLKHSFNKKYNNNGSIFTNTNNPFKTEETIIYGHNMKNGSMFSNLDKYMNKEFVNSHLKIKIFTPEVNYEGTIFSIYSTGVEKEKNNTTSLNFNELIEYYKNASKYKLNYDGEISNIVKLVTCSYVNATTSPTNQRYYIIASIYPAM